SHPSVRTLYARELAADGVVSDEEVERIAEEYRRALDEGRNPNEAALGMIGNQYTVDWSRYHAASLNDVVDTRVPGPELARLGEIVTDVPEGFQLNARLQKTVVDGRGRARRGLGLRGAPRLRVAAHREVSRPARGAGHAPRHVLSSPCGAARPGDRRDDRAARARHRRSARVHGGGFASVGRGRPRL